MAFSRRIAGGLLVMTVATATYPLVAVPSGRRSLREFDPDRVLVSMLREQYRYSWLTATSEGYHLAKAAATFGNARSNYEAVLPDLETGYRTAREWLHAGFDPRAVAEKELAWWVARRTPGSDSALQVGAVMADAYALLYEVPVSTVMRAAVLRAQAAKLRDNQAANPDWQTIGTILRESYRDLYASLARGRA